MKELDAFLKTLRPKGHVFFSGEYCGQFAVDVSGDGRPKFHVIAGGCCWLKRHDELMPEPLCQGDLVLFPHDSAHSLVSLPADDARAGSEEQILSLVCGYYEFDSPYSKQILCALSDTVVLRADDNPEDGWLKTLLAFMGRESDAAHPGSEAVIARLAEVLFLFLLRKQVQEHKHAPDLLGALAHPGLIAALRAIHEQAEKPWSVAALAAEAGLSRTLFSELFRTHIGHTPMAYLTQIRMRLARQWLRSKHYSMAQIAEKCGYANESAFTKAYKRITSETPGKTRSSTQ